MPITSPNNEQLKQVRKLAGRKWRDKTRRFVAEGEDLIEAAAAAGWTPELLLCEAGSGLRARRSRRTCSSSTRSSARARARSPSTRSAGRRAGRPGLRRAVGRQRSRQRRHRAALGARVGAGSVALGPGTADPYGFKAVRASMGAIFAVPVVRVARWGSCRAPRWRS